MRTVALLETLLFCFLIIVVGAYTVSTIATVFVISRRTTMKLWYCNGNNSRDSCREYELNVIGRGEQNVTSVCLRI